MIRPREPPEGLPALRRYAQALNGGEPSGDAHVSAILEAAVRDPDTRAPAFNQKIALFKAFTRIWNSIDINAPSSARGPTGAPAANALVPRMRQAMLLMAMEGFSEEEAAMIIGTSVPELRALVDQSGRELAGGGSADVLIIEDEPLIAMDLESVVESLGHTVIGIARTHDEALTIAKMRPPELILADIRLADMSSGIDAVNDLLRFARIPVVFITAYPEQFLTGERPEPSFLIAKPFPPAKVSAIISQALYFATPGASRHRSGIG